MIKNRIKKLLLASTFAATAILGSGTALADQAYTTDSFAEVNSVITPQMGGEAVIISGPLYVNNSYELSPFTLKNSTIKVVWSSSSPSSFTLQLHQPKIFDDGSVVINSQTFGTGSNIERYFYNAPTGKTLWFKVVGTAYGNISAYDWGAN